MAVRLHLKYGLVARSRPAVRRRPMRSSVTSRRPARSRTKGNLYVVVTVARRAAASRARPPRWSPTTIRDRVLLRRVGGHPDLPREGDPERQPDACARPRGPRPGRRLHRRLRGGRARPRAVRGDHRRRRRLPRPPGAAADVPEDERGAGLPADRRRPRRRLARRVRRRRLAAPGVAQPDRDGRHRGAQERGRDAPPAVRRGAPPPPLRGRRGRAARTPSWPSRRPRCRPRASSTSWCPCGRPSRWPARPIARPSRSPTRSPAPPGRSVSGPAT